VSSLTNAAKAVKQRSLERIGRAMGKIKKTSWLSCACRTAMVGCGWWNFVSRFLAGAFSN
jgi:hypothetical protein